MPILVDYSQLSMAVIFRAIDQRTGIIKDSSFAEEGEESLSPMLLRHVFLSSILYHKREFSEEFGEMIFCIDTKNSWRKKIFPEYKFKRHENKADSPLDWDMIHEVKEIFKNEIRDCLRFPVVEVSGAEADDIIAILAKDYSQKKEPVLILSSDTDFIQLQKYEGVTQYSMARNKYIEEEDPRRYLFEKILLGDKGDGIPNVLSDIKSFKAGIRMKSFCRKKRLPRWLDALKSGNIKEHEDYTKEIHKRFKQNQKLIDFDFIPIKVQEKIRNHHSAVIEKLKIKPSAKESAKFHSYFVDNGLTKLFERISEF